MKGKKLLAGVLSAAMVLGTMAFPVFADGENGTAPDWESNEGKNVVAYGVGENNKDIYTATLTEALEAVYKSNPKDTVTIECKDGADVGKMTHGHVADSLIIKGNNAYVSAGERDLEFDTYMYDRKTGKSVQENGEYLSKDVTVKVEKLNGIAAWGQRNTDHAVNLEFVDCQRMQRVYISGTVGTNNYKLINCTFDGTTDENAKPVDGSGKTSVYSNAPGTIEVNNCTFNNVALGINVNNKSGGEQTISISGCKFTDCATADNAADWNKFSAPIRLVTSGDGATINATIEDSTITGKNVGNGDILLGDGREEEISTPNVTLNISGTAAEIQAQEQGKTPTVKTVTAAESVVVGMPAVAEVNGVKYTSLKEAATAAQDGDTITIFGKVAVNQVNSPGTGEADIPKNKKLTFKGDSDGELILTSGSGYNMYYVNGSTLTFENLTLTWKDTQIYQGFAHPNSITYNNCTINGMLTLYTGKSVFNNCTFVQNADSDSAYNIWTWGTEEAEFNNCTFRCRGKSIHVYNGADSPVAADQYAKYVENPGEGQYKKPSIKIDNCEFYVENKVKGCDAAAVVVKMNDKPYDISITNSAATGFTEGKFTGSQLYDIKQMNTNVTDEDETAKIQVNGNDVNLNEIKAAIKNNTPADAKPTLKIAFEKADVENGKDNNENADVYNINVTSDSEINKLNSADLTFALETSDQISYAITGADDITVTQTNGEDNRYMFSYNEGAVRESGTSITIGQVTVSGYGKYTFKVDGNATSVVNATTLAANLVDTYATDGSADGKLDVSDSTTDENGQQQEIKVPTKSLTINVAMNNKVEDQVKAYQDMKIEIKGAKVTKTFDLGSDGTAQTANGGYTVTEELEQNIPYTVTVSGAGYRTARYTVNLNADKTLNFWNNVMDNAIEVELGNAAYKKNVTFLAGDIVKDNKINIYDLSAVVSYFGTKTDKTATSEYAKYDLNRDGVIDSKDVAYVLVSWGN